ncbi:MAG: hypothetical protein A2Z97_00695 [Bdellovibrionales bacterium GWB1_52_6]|nr:MAG: hypothetical protein A2Z97_00695 [Bdellovibrionales bacterium GWB1_52_6]OFZ05220.1 MAG: hypothetical protein A2X97_10530 [Bdellovibrionales bacterium GWA1_52_35]HCM38649.1 hypothetical protein [Bdellovibrionales bacterium]
MEFKKWHYLWILALSLTVTVYCFGPNMNARWWGVDDHEIMDFLGPAQTVKIRDIPQLLVTKTEVGQPGSNLRYRPSYYIIKLLQASFFGLEPQLWYAYNLIVSFTFFTVIFYLLMAWIGPALGTLCWIWIVSPYYWSDIFSRLGPGEIHAALGAALFSFGFYHSWNSTKHNIKVDVVWLLTVTGAIVAAGSKENFVLLLIPLLLLLYRTRKKKLLTPLRLISLGAAIMYIVGIASVVVMALVRAKHDFYANAVGPGDRLYLLLHYFTNLTEHAFLVCLTLTFSLAAYATGFFSEKFYIRPELSRLRQIFGPIFVFQCVLLSISLSQYVFYNGSWPTQMRYDFPGGMLPALGVFAIFRGTVIFFEASKRHWKYLAHFAAAILTLAVIAKEKPQRLRLAALENVQRTSVFTKSIESIRDKISGRFGVPLVFSSHSVWDYELTFSIQRFLNVYGVSNPMALELVKYKPDTFPTGSLERSLSQRLKGISEVGGSGFISSKTAKSSAPCFGVGLSGPAGKACEDLGRAW